MSARRILFWLRLLLGAGLMYQGVGHIVWMREAADLFAALDGWQSWPFVGGLRPLELVLWLAFVEFFLGVFLFCGLLTRMLSGVSFLIAGFQLAAVGFGGGLLVLFLLVSSATIAYYGGGSGTMDTALGNMQRRSIEREAARARAREAARRAPEAPAAAGQESEPR